MKHLLAALALLSVAAPATASDWFLVGKTPAGDARYVDLASVSPSDPAKDLVEAWSSTDLASPDGKVRSTARIVEYDCRSKASRSLGEAAYSEPHRVGTLVSNTMGSRTHGPMQPVAAASTDEAELTLVCDYAHRIPQAASAADASSVIKPELVVTSVSIGTKCCDADMNVLTPGHSFTPSDGNLVAAVGVFAKNVDRSESFLIDLRWTYGAQHDLVRHDQWNLRTGADAPMLDKRMVAAHWEPGAYAHRSVSGNILRWDRGNYHLDIYANGQLLKSFDFDIHG